MTIYIHRRRDKISVVNAVHYVKEEPKVDKVNTDLGSVTGNARCTLMVLVS